MAALALVLACGAIGLLAGWRLRPLVDRVTAERSEAGSASGRSVLAPWLTAGLFAATAWQVGWTWSLPAYLVLGAFLVVLSLIDLDTKTLPRRIVWAAGATGVSLLTLASLAAGEPERIVGAAVGGLGAFLLLCLLPVVARGGFGFGDVRLGAVLGWYLGWQDLRLVPAGLFFAFGLSAVVGLGLLAVRRAGRRTEVPFGCRRCHGRAAGGPGCHRPAVVLTPE